MKLIRQGSNLLYFICPALDLMQCLQLQVRGKKDCNKGTKLKKGGCYEEKNFFTTTNVWGVKI